MTAIMKIGQVGLGVTPDGQARTDGLANGNLVTLTSVGSGLVHTFRLLWVPSGDSDARSTLQDLGSGVWTFSPTISTYGSYRIELDVDGEKTRRIFGIRTPGLGLLIPALNETADENANLDTAGAAQVLASENNEPAAANNALNYAGWWVAWEATILALDGGGSGNSTIVTAVKTDADSPYATAFEETVRVDPDTGVVDVTLPLATGNAGRRVEVISVGALLNPPFINVKTQGGDTFVDGSTSITLDSKQEVAVVRSAGGTTWMVIVG